MFNFLEETVKKFGEVSGRESEPIIIFLPGRGVYIEAKCKIVSINRETVVLKVKKEILTVKGEGLMLKNLDKNSIMLQGKIVNLEAMK